MRDVERAMKVIMWFYTNSKLIDEVIREESNGGDKQNYVSDDELVEPVSNLNFRALLYVL